MYKPNQIFPAAFKICLLGVMFCFLWSGSLFAQEDCSRGAYQEEENVSSGQYELDGVTDGAYGEKYKSKGAAVKSDETAEKTHYRQKESALSKKGGEKDLKKEEMSTLSFNLFLYIVDRFKED